ncbi:hypothetical protein EJ03DRAFT_349118 [Teratosphaeria nubilosa]|uniref:Uncharacterized protein n=1 Tax=Teratosphaeria nubilosa TaxID=161662 RepID=A0A6G1LG31_9PEZI|nr:hypothetical protein EJ03DRAFT_349118 [Teratosphaeria nubilosa]
MIKRKPVPARCPIEGNDLKITHSKEWLADVDRKYGGRDHFPSGDHRVDSSEGYPDLDEQIAKLDLEAHEELPEYHEYLSEEQQQPTLAESVDPEPLPQSSKLKKALDSVTYFTGGLIAHPYEAARHYSILRHSHGLVYYQGPATSVAVTIFSDQNLPENRTLYLQKRGYSGKAGLAVGATLGTRSAWIDVTPETEATADLLPKTDERAWQRDIAKFLKKAQDAKSKSLRSQKAVETAMLRIPHAAEDGYFRIVLCANRKVLCPSPMFRYISASGDPGRLRGASLSTLPLELGVKIGAFVAKQAANTAAHGALQPAINSYQSTVQPVVQKYNPLGITQMAAEAAFDETVSREIGDGKEHVAPDSPGRGISEGWKFELDCGPCSPFPTQFTGIIAALDVKCPAAPTPLQMQNVSRDVLIGLINGLYIGWVMNPQNEPAKHQTAGSEHACWHQTIITVGPCSGGEVKVIQQKQVLIRVIDDDSFNKTALDKKINVMLMSYLRPLTHPTKSSIDTSKVAEIQRIQMLQDSSTAAAILAHPSWSPDMVLQREDSARSQRSFKKAFQSGQKQVEKVPLHRLGIRNGTMGAKDELVGRGGIFVRR